MPKFAPQSRRPSRRGQLHHCAAGERSRPARMAGRYRGADIGGPARRSDDVRAYRRYARIEPAPRSGVRSVTKGASLGAEEAQEGWVMDIYDGADWTEMDIEGIET